MLTPSLSCKLGDFGVSRLFEESARANSAARSSGVGKFVDVDPNIIPSGALPSWNPVALKSKKHAALSKDVLDETEYGIDQTSNVGTAR